MTDKRKDRDLYWPEPMSDEWSPFNMFDDDDYGDFHGNFDGDGGAFQGGGE